MENNRKEVEKCTGSAVLLDSGVVHFVGEVKTFMLSLQVDENQAGGGERRPPSV